MTRINLKCAPNYNSGVPRAAGTRAYCNDRGETSETAIRNSLQHVTLHGIHHHEHIAPALRDGNLTPANTDFITFIQSTI